ncbi:MAG: hypothetical protein ACRCY8_04950 [Dermatophilaceae bacterium]
MSDRMTDEKVVRDVLRARSEMVEVVDDFVDPSVGLARRRTRRAVGAVVAVAVVVAGGAAVALGVDRSSPPLPATRTDQRTEPVPTPSAPTSPSAPSAPSASPTPAPSTSASPTPSASGRAVLVEGSAPYAVDGTIYLDDRTIEVGEGRRVLDFAPLAGGGAVVNVSSAGSVTGPQTWRILDADGRVVRDLGEAWTVRASRDGRLVAVQDEMVRVFDERGRPVGPKDIDGSLVAVADGWVWTFTDLRSRGWEIATGATRDIDVRLNAVSADGRLGAAITPRTDDSQGCWLVVDLAAESAPVVLERCGADNPTGFSPDEFSDDGRHLIGDDDTDGGFYARVVVARVADGRILASHERQGDRADGWSWAFDDGGRTFLMSRNVGEPRFPTTRNDLARCTLDLVCDRVGDRLRLSGNELGSVPRYVVGRPLLAGSG